MSAKHYVQTLTNYLAGSGVIVGATSIILTSFTDIYGNALALSDFGDKGYGTLEPDTVNEEAFTFTTVTVNANGTVTLGGVSTCLAKSPYTETSGLIRAHSGGTKLVISDTVAFWNTFANVNNLNTFVILPQSAATPSANADLATKVYVDGVALAGAPNASTIVKGVVQEATQAQVLAKTAAGSTGAELYVNPATLPDTLLSDYKVDTGSANAYAIAPAPAITAYSVGQIFSFKAANANTTASTLNVNALGVKTIKNSKGGDLVANDILAGQIVVVEYDGTNFQMLSNSGNLQAKTLQSATTIVDVSAATAPSANQVLTATSSTAATWQTPATTFKGLFASGATTYNLATASGVQNIAHGLGVAPTMFNVSATFVTSDTSTSGAQAFNGNAMGYITAPGGTFGATYSTFTIGNDGSDTAAAVITATSTNIVLTWTKTGGPTGTAQIIWEALA